MNKKHLSLFFFLFSMQLFSQDNAFIGLIELENQTFLDFRVNFTIKDARVKGYTITDYNGAHETKSSIVGNYNEDTEEITFREVDILYTKSPVTELDFCYMFFTGKLKKNKLNGDFRGYYEDLEKCLDGKIYSSRLEKVEKRKEALAKKVAKLVKKEKMQDSLSQKIENIKLNERRGVKANENVNVFWEGTYLKVAIWDAGNVDGDVIEIDQNNNKKTKVSPKKKPIIKEYYLGGDKNIITVKALSEGTESPNTTKVKFSDGKGKTIDLIYSLKVNEIATLTFYKQKPSELKIDKN